MIWSFDDLHIGRCNPDRQSLKTREIPRPMGLKNVDWYSFAGKVCFQMNNGPDLGNGKT